MTLFVADGNHKDGIYTLFSDMGGQPQFWALVANFLRKYVLLPFVKAV
jgi:hypothetical protein